MSATRQPVTITTSTVSETTITSERMTVSFAVCTSGGVTRWSIAVSFEPGARAASQRLQRAIESLADAATSWSRSTPWAWSCSGCGWTEQHQALVDLAEALARFGAEGLGDA